MTAAALVLVVGATNYNVVYHFRDRHGVDHYVGHQEQVPAGVVAEPVDLTADLNPEFARSIEEESRRSSEEATARAKQEIAKRGQEKGTKGDAAPPAQPVSQVLAWAVSLTVVFLVLWFAQGHLRRDLPPLAAAFRPIRLVTGAMAALSWLALLYLLHGDWLAQHFPPLQALSHAREMTQKINQQQKEMEDQMDKLQGR